MFEAFSSLPVDIRCFQSYNATVKKPKIGVNQWLLAKRQTQKENISAVIDTITQKFNDKMFSGDGNVLETIGQLFGMLLLDYLEKEK